MHSPEDAVRFVQMCRVAEAFAFKDRNIDPLKVFFAHAPRARTLHTSQVLSNSGFQPLQGVTKWMNKHQQLVHHMYGSVYDAEDEIDKATALPSFTLKGCAIRYAYVQDDQKFALLINPGAHSGGHTPKVGDRCKISSKAFVFPIKRIPNGKSHIDINKILDILEGVPNFVEDSVGYVLERAPELADYSVGEIASLFRKYGREG